ncbi:Uncharacterized protein Adt_04384 [Abeliophyllum distichum]|uniref:Uncharacterized protein n=1 Tax=Abeliophyllum distichum TaxID=126358 RepID=A0ABD1W177_9LAMI
MSMKGPILHHHQGIIGHQEITHNRRGTAPLLRVHPVLLAPLLIRATSMMVSLHHHRSTPNTNTMRAGAAVDVAHFSRAAWPLFAVAVCWRSAAAAFRPLDAK